MKEEILHLVWKYQLINPFNSYATSGEKVQVVSPGIHNEFDAGPDFFAAKIRVGDQLWVGNVELHIHTSDWYYHLHHFDPAYQNIVLHVVYEDDMPETEGKFPILQLKTCVDPEVWDRIDSIAASKSKIPCHSFIGDVSKLDWVAWQDRLVVERFQKKSREVNTLYQLCNKDLDTVCFRLLLRSLGGPVNKEPFLLLGTYVPYGVIQKNKHNLLSIETLLFGGAGLLKGSFSDLYPNKLISEFEFLKAKYRIDTMETHVWKWLRLRPTSFPTIQIALLSSLLFNIDSLENLFSATSFTSFRKQVEQKSCLSPYWENHYKFDLPAKEKTKNWGKDLLRRIYINSVLPFQLFKSKYIQKKEGGEVLEKMLDLPSENNKVIREWKSLGIPVENSFESQAMLQLKHAYCSQKKCLNCNIGLKILKRSQDDQIFKENT